MSLSVADLAPADVAPAAVDPEADPLPPFELSLDQVQAALATQLTAKQQSDPTLAFDPKTVERDLTRLVLSLIEFVRQLLEAQAVRRMEAGRLTPEQEDALGETLYLARERLLEVAAQFGLTEQDLRLDLGPLGRVV